MAFLRSKKINGKQYFYLVESVRMGDKVKQRVVKYIGSLDNLSKLVKRQHGKKRE
jgi:hypothetical protein